MTVREVITGDLKFTDQQFIDELKEISNLFGDREGVKKIITLALKTIHTIPPSLSPGVLLQVSSELRRITSISYSDSYFNILPIDVFVDILVKSGNLALMRLSKKVWESRGRIYTNLLGSRVSELRGLLKAQRLSQPLPKWSSFLRTHTRFFECKDAAVDSQELKKLLDKPHLKDLFALTDLLKKGKMDEVVGVLEKLDQNLTNSVDALQLPLSIAFEREITSLDMEGFKKLLLDKENKNPKEWLKQTLKLISFLYKDGAWNIIISTTDASGIPCNRWLILGFIAWEDAIKNLYFNQWVARFSIAFPGRLDLTRNENRTAAETSVQIDESGTKILARPNQMIQKQHFVSAIKAYPKVNMSPKVSAAELGRIYQETGCEFWKYNLCWEPSLK